MHFDTDPSLDVPGGPGGGEAAQARCADALIKGFNTKEQARRPPDPPTRSTHSSTLTHSP